MEGYADMVVEQRSEKNHKTEERCIQNVAKDTICRTQRGIHGDQEESGAVGARCLGRFLSKVGWDPEDVAAALVFPSKACQGHVY